MEPDAFIRIVVVTAEPGTLPDKTTWVPGRQLAPGRPARPRREVVAHRRTAARYRPQRPAAVLQALINSVAEGCGLHLYIGSNKNYCQYCAYWAIEYHNY